MFRSQPTAVPITVFQPDCARQKCDERQGPQEYARTQSPFVAKPISLSKNKCGTSVKNQTDKIRILTSELRERQRKRLTSASSEAFDREEACSSGSTILADAYQRVATSTLRKVDNTRGRLRILENKIAGMRDNLVQVSKNHLSTILNELQALEEEKRDEENELYSTIFDLIVLKDTNIIEESTTNELMESMENEIIALTTENEYLEQQVSEHMCTIEFSNAVIMAQEEAFAKALRTKDDEISELLEHLDESVDKEIVTELAELQLSLKEVEAAKVKLETAFVSLSDLLRAMEMEKVEQEENVLQRNKIASLQQSGTSDAVLASKLPEVLLDEGITDIATELYVARSKLDFSEAAQIRLEAEHSFLEKSTGTLLVMQQVDQLSTMKPNGAVLAFNTKADLIKEREIQEARIADMTYAILELQTARCAVLELKETQDKKHSEAMSELAHTKSVLETERLLHMNAIEVLEKEHENAIQAASNSAKATMSKLEGDNAVLQQCILLLQREKKERDSRRQLEEVATLQKNVSTLKRDNDELRTQINTLHEKLQKVIRCSADTSEQESEVALLQQNAQIVDTEKHAIEPVRQVDCSVSSQSITNLQAQNCILEARTIRFQVELEKVRSFAEATTSKLASLEEVIHINKKDEHVVSVASRHANYAGTPASDQKRKYGVLDRINEFQLELLESHPHTKTSKLESQEKRALFQQRVMITELEKNRAKSPDQADVATSSQIISNRKSEEKIFIVEIGELGLELHWLPSAGETILEFHSKLVCNYADASKDPKAFVSIKKRQYPRHSLQRIQIGAYEHVESLVEIRKEVDDRSTDLERRKIAMESKQRLQECVRALGFLGFYVPNTTAAEATKLSIEPMTVPEESKRSLDCIAELAFLFL